MRARTLLALPAALGATLLLAGAAAAGGMATATMDPPPDDPTAGQPIAIGFTLLQHGETPTTWGSASLIVADGQSGERTSYRAQPSGGRGHWVAEVVLPAAGSYTFEVRHDLQIVATNFGPDRPLVAFAPGAATAATAVGGEWLVWPILAGAALLVAIGLTFVLRGGTSGAEQMRHARGQLIRT